MCEKGVLLAETLEKVKPTPDPTGWWISEKLDGVRAYWDGKNLYSRNNLLFNAPEWFKASLPKDSHLDGELWCGREQFERCIGIIKYHKGSTAEEWKHLCYLIFDAPVIKGNSRLPYEERHAFIEEVTKGAEYAVAVGIRKCQGQDHLAKLLADVCSHGAEGLMLRQPGSLYERVRSKTLLKVKTFLDAEAKVIGYTEGKNRLVGMLGALVLEMPITGHTFEVGTGFKDAERNWIGAKKHWPIGTVITYKYQNLTVKGIPRFPVYLRIRTDKTWEDVVADAKADIDSKTVRAVRRQPSLMTNALVRSVVSDSSAQSSAATAGKAPLSHNALKRQAPSAALPDPLHPTRAGSGSLLFTEHQAVGRAEAIAEAIAAREADLPNKRIKGTTAGFSDEAVAPGTRAIWSWRSNAGWNPYSNSDCDALETAFNTTVPKTVTLSNGYVVDLQQKVQYKSDTPKRKRQVRREVKDVVTRKLTRQLSVGILTVSDN